MWRHVIVFFFFLVALGGSEPVVEVERVPAGGVQPQAVVAADGTVHLVWFSGPPAAGNLWYARRGPADPAFTAPLRVNAQDGSAVALGSIRGAHLALGRDDRVHVVWNGSQTAQLKGPDGGAGMLYARSNDARSAFEPQRQLIQYAGGLDGGGSLAADQSGRVWVVWHASAGAPNESGRAVYLCESTDDGATFAREQRATETPTGACGCCALRAGLDAQGRLQVLYRGASVDGQRDQYLLTRAAGQPGFTGRLLDPWRSQSCPMSSSALAVAGETLIMAWETKGRIRSASVSAAGKPGPVQDVSVSGGAKHPTLAVGADGTKLLAWTEGTGWNKGGIVAWQCFDRTGKPLGSAGRAPDLPVWGLVAAVPRLDGRFLIIY